MTTGQSIELEEVRVMVRKVTLNGDTFALLHYGAFDVLKESSLLVKKHHRPTLAFYVYINK